jgi:hypothetical protein
METGSNVQNVPMRMMAMAKSGRRNDQGMKEQRNVYKILVGNPEGKRPLGRPARRWEDNIEIGLGEIGRSGIQCIHVAQDTNYCRAVVNTTMNLSVFTKCWETVEWRLCSMESVSCGRWSIR